ncbi:MAG: hypothetical protein WA485_19320, partial [Candidatus Sulfotelmatobacter sp.]
MSSISTSDPGLRQSNFQFRCIGCGRMSDAAGQDFRCADCRDLLEITYPYWKDARPDSAQVKFIWQDRKVSSSPFDLSGVWRFRDVLPLLEKAEEVVTLQEGNTPVYGLPQCARITG